MRPREDETMGMKRVATIVLWFALRRFRHSEHPGGGGALLVLGAPRCPERLILAGTFYAGIYFRAIVDHG